MDIEMLCRFRRAVLVGLCCAFHQGANAAQPPARAPRHSCESLLGREFYNVTVTAAASVAASGTLPAYCRISGHEAGTEHDMEVRLPGQWRGRYVQRGGGGFDGSIGPATGAPAALQLGAAQGANNGGHRDPTGAALLNDPRATERYAHTAILTATLFGKAVTEAYYGEAPAHSYYEGCSNGGRGALNAAAKYGAEFDGVVAMAPTLNMTGIIPAMTLFGAQSLPSNAQFTAIHAAVLARCDALDGATDGIVSRWQACAFDPGRDVPASVGLTPQQVGALRVLWSDVRRADGSLLYAGLGLGDLGAGAAIYSRFGLGHLRYVVYNDSQWELPAGGLNVEQELSRIAATIEGRYQFSASVGALVQYLRDGRKLLVWHGAEDPILSHRDTIRSWQQVTAAAGPAASANSRLYIAPGVAHCGGGAGADSVDLLATLMDWVEAGRAPGQLRASKRDPGSGQVLLTRPLCEFPRWPRYKGRGEFNEAGNFECVDE